MKRMVSQSAAVPRFTLKQILEGLEGLAIIAACYLSFFLKPWRDRWGLSLAEANRILPGDHIIPKPKTQFTHAVEINAPARYVWPWVAQIGQGRGGFYSYEALENLIGLQIYNSEEVLPEHQNPKMGDIIAFSPKGGYPVILCEPGTALAIETRLNLDTNEDFNPTGVFPKNYLHLSWLWYVEALGEKRSRFISRNRVTFSDSFKTKLFFGPMVEPIVFAMDRKMCLGIKKRAEHLYSQGVRSDE